MLWLLAVVVALVEHLNCNGGSVNCVAMCDGSLFVVGDDVVAGDVVVVVAVVAVD